MLIVYTLATHECTALTNWKSTADRFGYTYRILGMGQAWKGWAWRTRMYLDALQTNNEPNHYLYAFVDSSDVLFVKPYDFKEFKSEFDRALNQTALQVLVSTEGRGSGTLEQHAVLDSKCPHGHTWPYRRINAGSIVGTKADLIQLFLKNIHSSNDQTGLNELFCSNPSLFGLDYEHRITGTVFPFEYQWWHISAPKRLQSKQTETFPFWLHCPGKNKFAYHYFLRLIFPHLKKITWVEMIYLWLKKAWIDMLEILIGLVYGHSK